MHVPNWIGDQHRSGALSSKVLTGPDGKTAAWIVDDFLQNEVLSKLSSLFTEDGVWEDSYGITRRKESAVCTRDEWISAKPNDQFYHFKNLCGPVPNRPLAPGYLHWIKFKSLVQSEWLLGALRRLTGIDDELDAMVTGMILERGHFLKFHSDAKPLRRLCGVFYVSDNWRQGYGGEFEMRAEEETVALIPPLRNRLLLFVTDNSQLHRIVPLTPEAGDWRRCSVTVWWSARES